MLTGRTCVRETTRHRIVLAVGLLLWAHRATAQTAVTLPDTTQTTTLTAVVSDRRQLVITQQRTQRVDQCDQNRCDLERCSLQHGGYLRRRRGELLVDG